MREIHPNDELRRKRRTQRSNAEARIRTRTVPAVRVRGASIRVGIRHRDR